jgi:hypothetical protein
VLFFARRIWSLEALFLQPAIKSSAAKTHYFGCLAHVTAKPRESFTDQQRLNFLQAHLRKIRSDWSTRVLQAKMMDLNGVLSAHDGGAFNCVLEFPNVARPGVLREFLTRFLGKAVNLLVIAGSILGKKMRRQSGDILPTFS